MGGLREDPGDLHAHVTEIQHEVTMHYPKGYQITSPDAPQYSQESAWIVLCFGATTQFPESLIDVSF
jgi:hypothetical protein